MTVVGRPCGRVFPRLPCAAVLGPFTALVAVVAGGARLVWWGLARVEEEEAEQVEEEEGFRKEAPPGYSAERSRRTCVQL